MLPAIFAFVLCTWLTTPACAKKTVKWPFPEEFLTLHEAEALMNSLDIAEADSSLILREMCMQSGTFGELEAEPRAKISVLVLPLTHRAHRQEVHENVTPSHDTYNHSVFCLVQNFLYVAISWQWLLDYCKADNFSFSSFQLSRGILNPSRVVL